MTNRKKEVAKFFAGFEAFHAFSNGYFWLSGTTLPVPMLGITATPTLFGITMVVHAIIAVALGIYAWRVPAHDIHSREAGAHA